MNFREFIIKRFFETKPTDLEVIKPLTPQPVRHPFFPFDLNEFKPMTSEALAYIASMPSYENLSCEVYFLPQEPGAYKLSLKLSKAQWSYLHRALEGFFVHNRKIPRHLFKRLPGIQSVLFHSDIECTDFVERDPWYWSPMRLNVWGIEDTPKRFDETTMLKFDSTIQGAITAFYMHFGFNNRISPILDNPVYQWKSYGDNINSSIDIPVGFRIDIVNDKEYVISCLECSSEGVFDCSCRVKDGMVQTAHSYKRPYNERQQLLVSTKQWIV